MYNLFPIFKESDIMADKKSHEDFRIKSRIQAYITFVLMCILAVILFFLFKGDIPSANKELIYNIVVSFMTMLGTCVMFWFGTTFSSSEKDKMIYNSKPIDQKEIKKDP